LDVRIDVEHGPPRIASASITGIAQAIANNLAGVDLATARIPLRFIVGWNEPNPTAILRDEAGRVRVTGDLGRLARFDPSGIAPQDEVQAERAAREVVRLAVTRTIRGWGATVTTDDQSATLGSE
jgi:hypothetical protein